MTDKNIRNFCILAHVDHGKSTLADRFLEITKTVESVGSQSQFLDTNPISRERGITIKLSPVRMEYQNSFILNLIDTPGHVDFSYEVSRSLAAGEGALLLVYATQGIQAQTLAYFQKAKDLGLVIIPVVNKIDLDWASPEETALDLVKAFNFSQDEIVFVSAKTGEGIKELVEKIIQKIPSPQGEASKPLRALVFDSFYDSHKGVVVYLRIVDGSIRKGVGLSFLASQSQFNPVEIGYFQPLPTASNVLENGAVGFLATGLKDISMAQVGDTLVEAASLNQSIKPLPGYLQPKPMVFVGIYPVDQGQYDDLREAMGKLRLNDVSFIFEPESSLALGKGFRVGFLGPLHAEVVIQRLEREFDLELITTAPCVEYEVWQKGKSFKVRNVALIPDNYDKLCEPVMKGTILTPSQYLGEVLKVCQERRGRLENMEYLERQVKLEYQLPLSEIIVDFFSSLKSVSSGFASFNYDFLGFFPFNGVKLDILVNSKKVEALSKIVAKEHLHSQGRGLVEKLAQVIPKQMFEFSIQATAGSRIISRITKKAWRKDVTAKLYGGDQTRKDKLLKKQKKGKKRMKAIGRVYIPQEAFLEVLKR